jgi:hypothetical protein
MSMCVYILLLSIPAAPWIGGNPSLSLAYSPPSDNQRSVSNVPLILSSPAQDL